MCFVVCLFFFLGVENSKKLELFHILLVDNFDLWNRFNWGSYLWTRAVYSLTDPLTKRRAKQPKDWQYSVTGFIWPFKVYFMVL